MSVKKSKSKSKSKKKSASSAKRKSASGKKKAASKKTSRKKTTKEKASKAEIKKAVDKIPDLITKQIVSEKIKKEPEDEHEFSEEELSDLKKLFQQKNPTDELRYTPKKDAKKNFLWIGVITAGIIILIMWIWNVSVLFFDITKYNKNENSFIENVKKDFGTAMQYPEKEQPRDLQEKLEENGSKQNFENTLDLLVAELKNVTSTSSTVTMATSSEMDSSTEKTATSTLDKIKQILIGIGQD